MSSTIRCDIVSAEQEIFLVDEDTGLVLRLEDLDGDGLADLRINLDNEYIETWTFMTDIKILLKTVVVPFQKGCY